MKRRDAPLLVARVFLGALVLLTTSCVTPDSPQLDPVIKIPGHESVNTLAWLPGNMLYYALDLADRSDQLWRVKADGSATPERIVLSATSTLCPIASIDGLQRTPTGALAISSSPSKRTTPAARRAT